MPNPKSKFVFDRNLRRYRNRQGRFVSKIEIRRVLDLALRAASREISRLALLLREEQISLVVWELGMREAIKDIHLYSRALARGGWAQMTKSDFGAVGSALKKQYAYLSRFAAEIENGYPFDGRFIARTEMYAEAGRKTYYDAEDAEMIAAGMTEEENVLTSAEHCKGEDSCVEQTEKGWVPIGTLIQIGERQCLTRCRCYKNYR